MSKIGGPLLSGSSKLVDQPLGVVKIGFKGYDLGKTTSDCMLTPDQDIKDILYQQDGTKPSDHVRTGIEYIIKATFGEISTEMVKLLMAGVESTNNSASDDYGILGRSVYQSMRDSEADVLRVIAVDENGLASEEDADIFNFYEVIPIVTGDLIQWGADTQRNLSIDFKIKYHKFDPEVVYATKGGFGYWGDPTSSNVPVAVWPDVTAPTLLSVDASAATDLAIVFNATITEVGTITLNDRIFVTVNGDVVIPDTSVITGDTIACTFPVATFAAGDIIEFFMTSGTVENAIPIQNVTLSNQEVTNSLV
jgi:hypothetical protein